MKLHLSEDLSLPVDAVTQTFAFLARRGAGKTYGASKLCEEMHGAGAQVVILDPVGNWYGLRLAADGKGKGLAIPVFGGLRGDIPLEVGAGALVADLVVDRGISVVLDVSMFRKGERKRFATDFAEQLFHRKKEKRSPLHLFVEEAQVFVPQRVMGDEARMLGAFEDLVKLGRNFGVGVTLISQRPQSVNKDALNQTECLVVLQTNGSQERKALRDWIVDQGLDVAGLIDTLPGLKRGEAWVWSPSWLGVTKRIHIAKKKTFNASATPVVGANTEAVRELAPVDLAQIQSAMKDTIAKAAETDPKAMRKRIAQLEAELGRKQSAVPAPAKEKRVEVPVLKDGHVKRLADLVERLDRSRLNVIASSENLAKAIHELGPALGKLVAPPPLPAPHVAAMRSSLRADGLTRAKLTAPNRREARASVALDGDTQSVGGEGLGKGERQVLAAIAQHPEGVDREQLSVLTGYKRSSRDTYLQRVKAAGLIEQRGDAITATLTGIGWLGPDFEPLPTGEALRRHWLQRLPEGERKILEILLSDYPGSVPRNDLDELTGYKRSSRDTYLQRLAARKLITADRGEVRASDTLFAERAA